MTEHERGWQEGYQSCLKTVYELVENVDKNTALKAIKDEMDEEE